VAKAASTTAAAHAGLSAGSVDGWRLDDSNPLAHRVCRAIQLGELQLVLTIGDEGDSGPTSFKVSRRALRWLLTGAA